MAPLPRIVIIGSGFGGLGTAIALQEAGFDDVVILEKADGVGGVWRENTYPDAACDAPSSLYSWSFAPNPSWSHRFSRGAEILDYIERVARERGVLDRVRTGVEVRAAAYDDATATWTLTTSQGEIAADVVVSAVGLLSRPYLPRLPGMETFEGEAFHSAQWRHDIDLRGKRVAVVGTGASAIQFVPAIADAAERLVVFQRTAPYVVPRPDRVYSRLHQWLFRRLPATQAFGRRLTWRLSEQLNRALVEPGRPLLRLLHLWWRLNLRRHVRDPALRAQLVPDYPLGCKRMLFSSDWYPTIARDDVDLVDERVAEVLPHGVRSADGRTHQAEVIIWGTGFTATDFLAPMEVRGRGGLSLAEAWAGGARAYLGICVPDFPSFFLVYGPNTNLGGSSILTMMEAQAAYIVELVRGVVARGGAAVCRREAEERFDAEMQRRLAGTVWASCTSWYRDANGRIAANWPGTVAEYQQRTAVVDWADFEPVG